VLVVMLEVGMGWTSTLVAVEVIDVGWTSMLVVVILWEKEKPLNFVPMDNNRSSM